MNNRRYTCLINAARCGSRVWSARLPSARGRCALSTSALSAEPCLWSDWTSMTINAKAVTFPVAAVFEVDGDGKIAAWRDYLDSREVAVQVGADISSAGTRT
jgi:hypothetical protein